MEMTYIDTPADLTMQIGEAMFTQRGHSAPAIR